MDLKTILILVTTGIAALALSGVAFSLVAEEKASLDPTAVAESFHKAPGAKEKAHRAPQVDGQTWNLTSYDNVHGEICLSHEVPGEAIGTGCIATDKLFADGPVYSRYGARQISAPHKKLEWDNIYVFGVAHPSVQTLTLLSMDCSTTELALDDDGVFNHVVSKAKIKKGETPYKLIARGAAGQLLVEKDVAVGLPKNGVDAGLKAPHPKKACS